MSRYLFYISQNYSFAILRPLQKTIRARGENVAWFVESDEVNLSFFNKDELLLTSIEAINEFDPKVVFVPGNVVPSFIPGLKVGVFHGFNAGKLNRKGKEDHFTIRGCFDLYCTQGPNTTETFQTLAKKHGFFSVKETGWPAIDPLYIESSNQEKGQLPTILYCSTFSRNLTSAPHLFEEIKRLSKMGKWRWLIQFHPKMPKEIIDKYKAIESEHLTFIETDNVLPLLKEADLMVCDTSSVLLMFLLLNKPVVTFNNISPKNYLINITKSESLESSIEEGLSKPDILMKNISAFIAETHPYQDGRSSERVLIAVDEYLLKQNRRVKKPLNILREFKMRKKLNYWKL